MASRTGNSIRNIFFGAINRILAILIPFIFRTIIIYILGEEYLGLNTLFSSILQVLNVADIGIGSAISASMYKPIAENDQKTVSALLNLYRNVYRFIGISILTLSLVALPFLEKFINGEPPAGVNIYILFLLYAGNTAASYFFFSYKIILVTAHQRMDLTEKIGTITKLLTSVLQIIMLVVFKNITAYVACNMLCVIMYNLGCSFIADKYYPQYRCEGRPREALKKKIYKDTLALAYHKIGNTVSVSLDSIIISSFISLSSVAIYGNYNYICNAIGQFIALFFGSITASVGNSIATETIEKNYQDFKKISFANMWVVGWCSACLICLFQNFMILWTGENLLLDFVTMIVIVVCFYVTNIRKVVLTYKDAAGMWDADKYKPLVGCCVNLIVNIILVRYIKIAGVVLSTIISYLFIEQPWETRVLLKKYFNESVVGYYFSWSKMIIKTVVAIIVTYLLTLRIPQNILGFCIRTVICIFVPNIIMAILNIRNAQFHQVIAFIAMQFNKKTIAQKRK